MMLQNGQKVRLTERGLKFQTSVSGRLAPRQKWDTRTGTVARLVRSKTQAVVVWDGNVSPSDPIPITFLQPA
jgi:hypothetical protein